MHTNGDGLVVVQNESAYKSVVARAGDSAFLRQTFVHRAGHCAFTPAETITAVESLLFRLATGVWGSLDADSLNATASALGRGFNVFPSPRAPVICRRSRRSLISLPARIFAPSTRSMMSVSPIRFAARNSPRTSSQSRRSAVAPGVVTGRWPLAFDHAGAAPAGLRS